MAPNDRPREVRDLGARIDRGPVHRQSARHAARLAAARGLEVAAEFVTEDSAWASGNGRGAEFDKARAALLDGTRLGRYQVVLCWAIDRLSRKGIEDTLATMRRLYEHGADIWSHTEGWLETSDPHMKELLVSFMAWMAQQESLRRSERTKQGLARRRAEGKPVGRQPGAKDRKPRRRSGYVASWEARRAAAAG